MKRMTVAFGVLLVVIVASSIYGQRGRMMMGPYDSKAEITIYGTVEKLDQFEHWKMPGMGIYLAIKNGNETTEVYPGPAAFVEKSMTFKEGDTIEVVGSKATMMGRTVFLAREIKKDGKVLKLRDENGMPLWPGMQRPISDVGRTEEEELCLPDVH
jgi:hypothetical protein